MVPEAQPVTVMSLPSRINSYFTKTCGTYASGKGESASLAVLTFHRVVESKDPLLPAEPDAIRFSAIIKMLSDGFRILRLSEACQLLFSGKLPPRSICITFDDGYANNFDVALPILKAFKVPATVFIAPGFLNGGIMFNDIIIETIRRSGSLLDLSHIELGQYKLDNNQSRVTAIDSIISRTKHLPFEKRNAAILQIAKQIRTDLPTNLMMSDSQVKQLHQFGIEIGAHTMTHPILTSVDDTTAKSEILDSKLYLESLINGQISSFAYPNGKPHRDYNASHVEIAKSCGFEIAVTTSWGAAKMSSDHFQIPRIAPWDKSTFSYMLRILRSYRQHDFSTV